MVKQLKAKIYSLHKKTIHNYTPPTRDALNTKVKSKRMEKHILQTQR